MEMIRVAICRSIFSYTIVKPICCSSSFKCNPRMAVCGHLVAVATDCGFHIVRIHDVRLQPWKTLKFELYEEPLFNSSDEKVLRRILKCVFRSLHQLGAFNG